MILVVLASIVGGLVLLGLLAFMVGCLYVVFGMDEASERWLEGCVE